ncbi:MAG TPA: right-handed parallel beta-helix repeat-containing protein [Thermoguttaceae bacterium]|nr:right-handed parallel beta-helix repeat-containing protein [Thermoguttaceae bacterium]
MLRRTRVITAGAMTLAMVLPGSLPAATYFVDQGHPQAGDDNVGSEAAPWKTINHAATVLRAGDTVLVKQGTYNVGESPSWAAPAVHPSHAGTQHAPITFQAHPGHRVRITTSGGQAAIGSGRDYVVWDGFVVDMADRMKGILIFGAKGCVVRYCEVIGNYVPSGDNHDGIRIERAPDCRVHHCVIHGVQGNSHNSAAVKVYSKGAKNVVVEDNYIYDNTAGVFDKDFGVDNTFRRNYFTRNRSHFYGNNQGGIARYFIHDNVFDGRIELHAGNKGTEIHDNLFRCDSLAGAWAGGVADAKIWNNVVISGARSITACQNKKQELSSALGYMDYNVYDAPPVYDFGEYTPNHERLSLAQMRSRGFEENSRVISGAEDVFEDGRFGRLLPAWKTAGRHGDAVGPEDIASILDLSRYGPSAVRPPVSSNPKD